MRPIADEGKNYRSNVRAVLVRIMEATKVIVIYSRACSKTGLLLSLLSISSNCTVSCNLCTSSRGNIEYEKLAKNPDFPISEMYMYFDEPYAQFKNWVMLGA